MSLLHCLRSCSGLMALGLLVGLAGDAKAQPTCTFTTLDVAGSTYTEAYGINASGQIVGYYEDADHKVHSFLFDQGSYTTFDVPGWSYTFATGINASGQIVGWYNDSNFYPGHGFLLAAILRSVVARGRRGSPGSVTGRNEPLGREAVVEKNCTPLSQSADGSE